MPRWRTGGRAGLPSTRFEPLRLTKLPSGFGPRRGLAQPPASRKGRVHRGEGLRVW